MHVFKELSIHKVAVNCALLIFLSTLGAHAQSFYHPFSCQHRKCFAAKSQVLPQPKPANSGRNDSIDVLTYNINLDITDFASRSITGFTESSIQSKVSSLSSFSLDLLNLTIDSIMINGVVASYTYNDTLVTIQLPSPANDHTPFMVRTYYHGQPQKDGSGWGGFYFSGNYAYNLGVGFGADPHNYGRVWFPCVDDFVDKARYEFHITTKDDSKAFCNGLLIGSTNNGNGTITWDWEHQKLFNTYLASVAIGQYTSIEYNYTGIEKNFPVVIAAIPSDTADARASFINLDGAIAAFETGYGAHPFDKVGFSLVPFNSGAMEHVTNIAFPIAAASGSLAQESLMAHELAHHWWGDNITCETAEDMWLNEGWASYSESLFFEHVYGKERYKSNIRNNHADVLQYAHIRDDGYKAISGVSHAYTYGDHVYNKGADVAHSLRGYMGYEDFFNCLNQYTKDFEYGNASSQQFRDYLSTCSGKDLTSFFDNWVFDKGFPHFSIDSFSAIPAGGNFDVTVNIRQRVWQAPDLYTNVPLEVTYISADWDSVIETVNMSGGCGIHLTSLSFEPVFVALDMEEKISDAIVDQYFITDSAQTLSFQRVNAEVEITNVTDDALIRVEYNYLAPDPFINPASGLHLSQKHYWKVDGVFPDGYMANASFIYNGSNAARLDDDLIKTTEDSLVLLYREGPGKEWVSAPNHTINVQGSVVNRIGRAEVTNVQKGEYTLAIYDAGRPDTVMSYDSGPCEVLTSSVDQNPAFSGGLNFVIRPNPANDTFFLELHSQAPMRLEVVVYDMLGRVHDQSFLASGSTTVQLDCTGWEQGNYIVQLEDNSGRKISKQLLIID